MTTYRNITVLQLPAELQPVFEYWDLNELDVEVLVRYYKSLINLVQTYDGHTLDYLPLLWLWRQLLKNLCNLKIDGGFTGRKKPEKLKAFFESKRTSFDNKKLFDEFIGIYYECAVNEDDTIFNTKCHVEQDYFEIRNFVEEYRGLLDSLESMSDKLEKDTNVSGHELTLCINSLFQVTKILRLLCSFESSNKEKVELLDDANEPSDNSNDDMSCSDMSCESIHDEDIEEVKMEIKELEITDDVISLFNVPDEAFFKPITVPILLRDDNKFFLKDVCIDYNFERVTTKNLEEYETENSNWNTRPDKYTSSLSTPGITKKFMIEHKHDLENLCSIGREWLNKYDSYYARIFKENNYDPGTIEAFLLFEPIESTSINFLLDCEVDDKTDIISTENSVVHRTQIICSELLLTMNASHTKKMISVSSSHGPIECSKNKCIGAREFNCKLHDGMEEFLDDKMCFHYSKWKVCNKPIGFEDESRSNEDNQICSKCKITRCVDCCYKIVPFLKNDNKYTCGNCKLDGLCVFCMPDPEEREETELISCDDGCNNTYCINCIRDYDITYFKCTYCSTSYCSLCFIQCPGCLENVCKDCMYERGGSFYCPCCDTLYCPGCQQTIQIKCAGCDRNVCEDSCIEIACDICGSNHCTDCKENILECSVCQNDVCEKCWDKDNNCCNSCTQNQDY